MSVLAPFLKVGVTFALFHEVGTVLVTKLQSKIFSKPLMIGGPAALLLLIFIGLLKIFSDSKTEELQVGAETL